MKTKKSLKYVLAIIVLIVVNGCSSLEIVSKWQQDSLTIDGSKKDWENNLQYIKDEKVAVGITNDNNNLYLCLVVSDNMRIMRILKSGLTIWIDPKNSDGEKIGIQYPIKNRASSVRDFSKNFKNIDQKERQKKIFNKLILEQNEFVVLNEDEYPLFASPINKGSDGIELKMNYEYNQLVYELKIPLTGKDNLLKINPKTDKKIRLGFITGKLEYPSNARQKMGGGMAGGQRGGGMSGGGRRGGMAGRGGMQGMRSGGIEGLNFWVNAIIASK